MKTSFIIINTKTGSYFTAKQFSLSINHMAPVRTARIMFDDVDEMISAIGDFKLKSGSIQSKNYLIGDNERIDVIAKYDDGICKLLEKLYNVWLTELDENNKICIIAFDYNN